MSLLGTFANARVRKMTRRSRKLDEEEVDIQNEDNPEVDNENPDLEMLEDLENEVGTDNNNIFQELMEQKMNMIERLELLESMVNEELLNNEEEDDKHKGKHKPVEAEHAETKDDGENWIIAHRTRLINLFVLGIIFGFILLIGWKLSKISADLVEKKKAVKMFQKKLEEVDEKGIDSLVASWKDQREGIEFMANPTHNREKPELESSQLNLLHRDISKLEEAIEQNNRDLTRLDQKEKYFLEEIEKLRFEYNQTKKKVLEEGRELGLYDKINRQYPE